MHDSSLIFWKVQHFDLLCQSKRITEQHSECGFQEGANCPMAHVHALSSTNHAAKQNCVCCSFTMATIMITLGSVVIGTGLPADCKSGTQAC